MNQEKHFFEIDNLNEKVDAVYRHGTLQERYSSIPRDYGMGYLVPTNPGCLQLAGFAVAAGAVAEGYSAISFVGFNSHSMALFLVFWFAILTGWGRRTETDEELARDGITVE